MGFFTGRVSFTRFQVTGRHPAQFGPEQLDLLAGHAIGKQRIATGDGVEAGWIAGDHILDTDFQLEKNILNDTLHFALRIDQQRIPADLLRAYFQVELQALARGNPSGHPSHRQKREARLAARDRIEQEAEDGRFLHRKACPILWDGQTRELLVATTAVTVIDRLITLFKETFNLGFEPLTAGGRAFSLAELREQQRSLEDAEPAVFVPGAAAPTMAWAPDEASRDFLGNEFLLWLWYVLDAESDTIKLSDDSEVTGMIARSLVLECPRGQTGRETIQSDNPSRLPEARRAIQSGKLPRKMGLTLVRHDSQYEFTLQAETLAVTGAKLPAVEDAENDRVRLEERVNQLRHLIETLDLLYDVFGRHRLGSRWPEELGRIQKWLQHETRRPAPALATT